MKKFVLTLMLSLAIVQLCNVYAQTHQVKVKKAREILRTLAYYFENDGIIPELHIRKQLKQPAFYTNYQKPKILLDDKMFEISRSFGEDSTVVLAFVLGHEMAHHYLKHSPGDINDLKTHEKDADKWGCFYSHVAGYKVTPVLYAKLLDKIYAVYKLSDNIPHYPSKEERKKLGLQKVKEIQDFNLGEVFNSARFLFAMGKLEKSIECLEFIFNKHFKSAEMCNNLAVSYLSKIAQTKPLYQRVFLFPFEFDGNTSLRSANTRINLPQLYEKSELLLRKALSIRKNYETAHLNLACLQIMKKKFGSAIDNLLELKNKQGKLSTNVHALLALAYALKDNHPKAQAHFKEALSAKNNYIAKCNYKIYNVLVQQGATKLSEKLQSMKEYEVADLINDAKKNCMCSAKELDGVGRRTKAFTGVANLSTSKTVIGMQPYFEVKSAQKPLLSGYHYLKIKMEEVAPDESQQKVLSVYELGITPSKNHKLSLSGIKPGDPVKKLTAVFEQPNRIVGNFYIYENHHLIVETQKNNIIGWIIYRKVE